MCIRDRGLIVALLPPPAPESESGTRSPGYTSKETLPPGFSQPLTNRGFSRSCCSCFQDQRLAAISRLHSAPVLHNRDKQARTTQRAIAGKLAATHSSVRKRQRHYWCVDGLRKEHLRAPHARRYEW